MAKTVDLVGKRINKLIITDFSHNYRGPAGWTKNVWWALCDCGKRFTITTSDFNKGKGNCLECSHIATSFRLRRDPVKVAESNLYSSYRQAARDRDIEFNLTREQFASFLPEKCNYCGVEPLQLQKNPRTGYTFKYNGIDRVDNNAGYTIDNCVTCCYVCNEMKMDKTLKEFFAQIKQVYKFNNL